MSVRLIVDFTISQSKMESIPQPSEHVGVSSLKLCLHWLRS